jgi:ribokinase
VLNESEYLSFRSIDAPKESVMEMIQNDFKNWKPTTPIIVTLGQDGVLFKLSDAAGRLEAHAVSAVDSTGAGDCFAGVYAAMLSLGRPDVDAIRFANAAAAISVTRPGAAASMPAREEIEEFLRENDAAIIEIASR